MVADKGRMTRKHVPFIERQETIGSSAGVSSRQRNFSARLQDTPDLLERKDRVRYVPHPEGHGSRHRSCCRERGMSLASAREKEDWDGRRFFFLWAIASMFSQKSVATTIRSGPTTRRG